MNRSFARVLHACSLCLVLACSSALASEPATITLRQAIDAALDSNPQLQGFAFRRRAQAARIEEAGFAPAPEVSIEVENFAGRDELRGFDSAEATLGLSNVIELGGKRAARIGAQEAALDVLEAERQARQLDVLAEVTRRFIVLAVRQEQLALAERGVALAKRIVAASERRVDAAKAPHAELDRARIAQDRAVLDQRRAESALDSAGRQLAAMWGESQLRIAGRAFGRAEAELFAMPRIEDFETLSRRLAANPDFLRFASEARLRDAELRLAATLRKPDVQWGAGVRRFLDTDDTALVASFSVPLFSARRARSQEALARAERELVDVERRAADVEARATLYELHRELGRAVSEAATLERDILPRTEEAMNEVEHAYRRGRYGFLELIDAQRELLSVQADLITASANAHALRTEIERLVNAPLTGTGG